MARSLLASASPAAAPVAKSPVFRCHQRSTWWSSFLGSAAALVYPPRCAFCAEQEDWHEDGVLLCPECRQRLLGEEIRCPACARPAPQISAADGRCGGCRSEGLAFDAARVLGSYQQEIREAVLKIKHAWYEPLATALGLLLARRIAEMPLPAAPDLVVPVPMHWLRRLWRGTNAAATLAEAIARELSIPLAGDLVICRRLTRRQSLLPASERRENVRGAYGVSSAYDIRGATILVVDDVLTTTATCDAVARELRRAGAARVFAAALARAAGA